ncbi:PadR family transcriptional regulator [Agromyces sp. NPDC004153]
MSRTLPELTTTSYAILGLLAIKPWSTYELAKQMRRDLRFMWPRAESNLYAEPKKLIAHGFATASPEPRGRRRRTVYTITTLGRHALREWIGQPAAGSRWESEAIVKLLFATNGTPGELLTHLRRFREDAVDRWRAAEAIFRPYLAGAEPFPERTHVNVLAATLVLETAHAEAQWADRAIAEVRTWRQAAVPERLDAAYAALRSALDAGAP